MRGAPSYISPERTRALLSQGFVHPEVLLESLTAAGDAMRAPIQMMSARPGTSPLGRKVPPRAMGAITGSEARGGGPQQMVVTASGSGRLSKRG